MGNKPISKLEDAPVGIGNLYSMDHDRKITHRRGNVTITNGLAWSKDNKKMFYIDSAAKKIWAYDFDLDTGTISK